jgi:hypothetical protein
MSNMNRPGLDGAHEKGGVEGEIGRFRRKAFVPVPSVASMTELNAHVEQVGARDDGRHIGNRRLSVAAHFEAEAIMLQPLPLERFDATARLSCRVDSKSRVCVRQAWYSVPARYVGRRVEVCLSADSVDVIDGTRLVASHTRSAFKGTETLVLDHYLEALVRKPGALVNATALARAQAGGAFSTTHQQFWDTARRRLGDQDGTPLPD